MKLLNTAQFLAAAALALTGLGVASTAQAATDLYFSVGVQAPGYYNQPAPVYVEPRIVYEQPQPVYLPQIQSAPAVVYQDPWRYEQELRSAQWQQGNRRHHRQQYRQYQPDQHHQFHDQYQRDHHEYHDQREGRHQERHWN